MAITYDPHKFQRLFHKNHSRIRIVDTGRQTGKTFSGTVECLWHLQQGRSECCGVLTKTRDEKYECTKCNKACKFIPIKAMVVAPTYGDLSDINIPMMKNLIPHIFDSGWNEQKKRLTLPNGSTVVFKSADHPDRLRGGTLDYLWLDEASFMKAEVWEIVKPATLVKQATIVVTTTPRGLDWVKQTFYDKASSVYTVANPLEEVRQEPLLVQRNGDSEITAFHYRTFDVDHIPLADILKEKTQMSERMFRQEYLATFETFSGLVYHMFDEKIHLIDMVPDTPMQYFVGIDVGYNNPTAILLIGEDMNHNLYIIDEVYESKLLPPDVVEKYKVLVAGKEIREVLIDPSSQAKTQAGGGVSVYDQLAEHGLNAIPANNDVKAGIARVSELLTLDRISNRPKLFICKRCVRTRSEFMSYIWQETRNGVYSEDPKKEHDHAMDALKYVALHRPDWRAHTPSSQFAQPPINEGAVNMLENRIDPDLF